MKINSIVFYKRFEKDPTNILYSPMNIDDIYNQYSAELMMIQGYVTKFDAIYDLDSSVSYGSNEMLVNTKPDHVDTCLIKPSDILAVQEADIELD